MEIYDSIYYFSTFTFFYFDPVLREKVKKTIKYKVYEIKIPKGFYIYDSITATITGMNQTGKSVFAQLFPTNKKQTIIISSEDQIPKIPLENSVQRDTKYIFDDIDSMLKKRSITSAKGKQIFEPVMEMIAKAFWFNIDVILTAKPDEVNTPIVKAVDFVIETIPRFYYFKYLCLDKRNQKLRRLTVNKQELFTLHRIPVDQFISLIPRF